MAQQQPGTATATGGSGTSSGGSVTDKASAVTQTAKDSGAQVAQTAKESGAQVAQTAKESGAQVAQTAVDQAKSVASEAQRQTRNLVGEAQGQLKDQARTQQQRAREGLRSLGHELHSMARNSDQSGPATEFAHQAGDRAHAMADWLEQREPGDLLDELRRFARRRPGAFVFGALVAGVVAGRMTRGIVAARSDESDTFQAPGQASQPDWSDYQEAAPVGESLASAPLPAESGFSGPYEDAMASPATPTAYVTDPSPASGPPIYGAPTAYSGQDIQERP